MSQTLPPQTPQSQSAPLPGPQAQYAPSQASPPPKTTPTKTTLKALPTVRDHTTDQLGPGGDEYLPREIDENGEKKVMPNGQLLGNREYRCRTFLVPGRGDKLFMLATECARVLGYRDSYLLFNKNRSLYKIIANQVEKDDLVAQEILPFSYRSRQIAIVTARSMFRQFGSRVVTNGRRVRDDYWETKARKQGFTEADLAGEKRPGATKAREAAAAEANQNAMLGAPHGEIVYSNTGAQFGGAPQPLVQPGMDGPAPGSSVGMPMVTLGIEYDTRSRSDYSNILKTGPRQEITGPPYADRTQSTPLGELHAQAHHAAEFNRTVNQGRDVRSDFIQNYWRKPHEQPPTSLAQPVGSSEAPLPTSRTATASHGGSSGLQQPNMLQNQSPQMLMTAAPYSQPIPAQNTMPPSMRGMPPPFPAQRAAPTSVTLASTGAIPQPQGYSYPQPTQMWPQAQQTPQYNYSHQTAQPSPHQQPSSASQIRHSGSTGQVPQQGGLPYSGMPGMSPAYPAQSQAMPYDQTPRQYMHPGGTAAPAVTQAWSSQQPAPSQWWANQGQ